MKGAHKRVRAVNKWASLAPDVWCSVLSFLTFREHVAIERVTKWISKLMTKRHAWPLVWDIHPGPLPKDGNWMYRLDLKWIRAGTPPITSLCLRRSHIHTGAEMSNSIRHLILSGHNASGYNLFAWCIGKSRVLESLEISACQLDCRLLSQTSGFPPATVRSLILRDAHIIDIPAFLDHLHTDRIENLTIVAQSLLVWNKIQEHGVKGLWSLTLQCMPHLCAFPRNDLPRSLQKLELVGFDITLSVLGEYVASSSLAELALVKCKPWVSLLSDITGSTHGFLDKLMTTPSLKRVNLRDTLSLSDWLFLQLGRPLPEITYKPRGPVFIIGNGMECRWW